MHLERPNDRAYFAPIIHQMEQADGLGAMMHDLMTRELVNMDGSEWDVFTAPDTDGKAESIRDNLQGADALLVKIVTEGGFTSAGGTWQTVSDKPVTSKHFGTPLTTSDVEALLDVTAHPEMRGHVSRLGMRLKALGVPKARARSEVGRPPKPATHYLPQLREFRDRVLRLLKLGALSSADENDGVGTPDEL